MFFSINILKFSIINLITKTFTLLKYGRLKKSFEKYSKKIYDLALKLKIDAICPCANDFAAISCSYVAEKLGFTHYDDYKTSLIIHHKDKFREFSIKHHLSVPMAKSFDSSD